MKNFITEHIEAILFIICLILMFLGITGIMVPDLREMGIIPRGEI